MRTVLTSNGLEWDTDGSAYLDAIPLVPRADLPITLRMVLAAMTHMDWLDWAAWMKGAQHPALKGYVGVVGVAARRQLALRYMWRRGSDPADGLYAIEARDSLPAEIAAAVLAAATAKPASDTAAMCVRLFGTLALAPHSQPAASAPRLHRTAMDAAVAQFVRRSLAGQEPSQPPGATNRARFLLALGAHLWQPATLAACGAEPNLTRLSYLNEVAMPYAILHPGAATYLAGRTEVRWPPLMDGSTWAEACNWAARRIAPDAARFFGGFAATEASWRLASSLPAVDLRHADAVAAGLLRAARDAQVYAASGEFVLALPEHLPWHSAGIAALAIHAAPTGLWCAGLTPRRERTASWWWSPAMTSADLLQHTLPASGLVHATLAAFWHDLVVAGDEVIVTPGRQPAPAQPVARPIRGAGAPVLVLPRRSIHLTGQREWGTAADREIVTRRSHGVRGHVRQLPGRWVRSEQAEREAGEWGIVLPEGHTFVRPHVRGGHDRARAPVVARARGLQTISALL